MDTIDTIIFDADGVILDTERIWDKAQEEFLLRRGCIYNRAKLKPMMAGKSLVEGVVIMQEEYGFGGDPKLLALERMQLVREQMDQGLEFVAGFRDFFERVHEGYKTCVATAMAEDLLEIVDRRLGLSNLFPNRIFSLAAVGHRSKPNPDIFLHAAVQIGSQPDNCVVIEDAPHGIEAARRAGMKSIGLTTTFKRQLLSAADVVVDSFEEIDLASF